MCKYYSEKLLWAVDKFHIRKHVEKKCILASPDCVYHPDTPTNKKLFGSENLEVFSSLFVTKFYLINFQICEQSFSKINRSKMTTRYMTLYSRLVFLKTLDDERNER